MPRRKTLTERQVQKLPRREKRYSIPDPVQPNLILRVPAIRGPVAFTAVARRKKPFEGGRQIWRTVGTSAYMTLDEARALTRDVVRRVRLGLPLDDKPQDSFTAVAEKWFDLVVRREGHRTGKESERVVRKYLLPRLGDRIFATIGRSDLANVLDEVAGNHGTAQADHSLKIFAAIASWWAARDDSYQSPIVRGLRRGKTVKRARILNDGEIRAVWRTCDAAGSAGAFLQFALLCGQRYGKIATMRWDDLDGDVWIIRQDVREKGTAGFLKLPPAARSIIKRQPRISGKDCIFGPLHNRVLAHIRQSSGVADWTIHDLRRSARTLLSRAGVQSEVAERVLGHVIGGVEGVYNRHQYVDEMGVALERLAALVERVVNPPPDNVVPLEAAS